MSWIRENMFKKSVSVCIYIGIHIWCTQMYNCRDPHTWNWSQLEAWVLNPWYPPIFISKALSQRILTGNHGRYWINNGLIMDSMIVLVKYCYIIKLHYISCNASWIISYNVGQIPRENHSISPNPSKKLPLRLSLSKLKGLTKAGKCWEVWQFGREK